MIQRHTARSKGRPATRAMIVYPLPMRSCIPSARLHPSSLQPHPGCCAGQLPRFRACSGLPAA